MSKIHGLIDGLKAGSADAQQQFWRQFWPNTHAICAKILGSDADASDVTVDLLSDFIDRRVHNIEEPKAVRNYIRLMAVRQSMEMKRKRDKNVSLDDDYADHASNNPEEKAIVATLLPRLVFCLDGLTPKARQTLRLKYYRQLSNERIGELLGGSKQYIGRLIQKSLTTLRTCLEKKGAIPKIPKIGTNGHGL